MAKIGTKTYASLEAAVKDAKNGDIVELMQERCGQRNSDSQRNDITIDFKRAYIYDSGAYRWFFGN